TAATEFEFDCRLDDRFAELHDLRLDGEAISRRSLDDAHVAQSHQTHVERPGYRRRGKREHVNALLQLLETLLVRDAKSLFFVDDDEAEVAERHVLRQKPVRTDDDVDVARLD